MKIIATLPFGMLALAIAFGGTSVCAQDAKVPGHPRVNEVNQRIDNQQARTSAGAAKGTVTAAQAARDEQHAANIAQRASADEARHNGHLTKAETARLNHAENRNSRHIRRQRRH
jgi:hypothetical protein